jgi:8-amino-7-oxononanoate synthase
MTKTAPSSPKPVSDNRSDFFKTVERRARLVGYGLVENGHPFFVPTDGFAAQAQERGADYLNMAHYDYLGLAHHPEVRAAAKEAIDLHGTGAGASRLVGGERLLHAKLEQGLAHFMGVEAVVATISGYATNASIIPYLMTKRDLILADSLSHNSIVAGAKASNADLKFFEHNDMADLERLLVEHRGSYSKVLIVSEGLFSMDGDITDLPRLLELKREHNAWLFMDEAHSIGVLGATGRGICEHYGIDPREVDVIVGTLSKTFASSGGFICTAGLLADMMRFTLPAFVYSVGLSPATTAGALQALRLLEREPERVTKLRQNSQLFVKLAQERGYNTGDAIGEAVVPLIFASQEDCATQAEKLARAGVYAPPIFHVGVPKDGPRIRFFLSAAHSEADIRRVFEILGSGDTATQTHISK